MPTASGLALQLPSITSLACHTLAIVLIPLLAPALVLIVHQRRSRRLVIEVRRANDHHWHTTVVRDTDE